MIKCMQCGEVVNPPSVFVGAIMAAGIPAVCPECEKENKMRDPTRNGGHELCLGGCGTWVRGDVICQECEEKARSKMPHAHKHICHLGNHKWVCDIKDCELFDHADCGPCFEEYES